VVKVNLPTSCSNWDGIQIREDGKQDLTFENGIVGGVIPRGIYPAVQKGFQEAMKNGIWQAYPIDSMKVRLFHGSSTTLTLMHFLLNWLLESVSKKLLKNVDHNYLSQSWQLTWLLRMNTPVQ
jgi:hypothetical protein